MNVLVPTEVIVGTTDVQLVFVHLKRIIERYIPSRVSTVTVLVTYVIAQHIAVLIGQQIGTMVGVAHIECFRFAQHTETRHTECRMGRQTEVQTSSGKHSSAFMGLQTVLNQMTRD